MHSFPVFAPVLASLVVLGLTACAVNPNSVAQAAPAHEAEHKSESTGQIGASEAAGEQARRPASSVSEVVQSDSQAFVRASLGTDLRLHVERIDARSGQQRVTRCPIQSETYSELIRIVDELRNAQRPQLGYDCPAQTPDKFLGLQVARKRAVGSATELELILKQTSGQGSCGDFEPVSAAHARTARILVSQLLGLAGRCQ